MLVHSEYNMYMGWWKKFHIFGGKVQRVEHGHIKLYKRYVEDLLFIWWGTEIEFIQVVEVLNHNDHNLGFTYSFNQFIIDFLDFK